MANYFDYLIADLFGGEHNYQRNQRGYVQPTSRNQRLYNEIMMLAPAFYTSGGINYDEQNFDWVMIPNFSLPRRLQEKQCNLLILLPQIYPDIGPLGFYVDKQIHLRGGQKEPNAVGTGHHGAQDLTHLGWYWYCVTTSNGQGGWRPSVNYWQPDNLVTFLNMVRESLTNDF